jgi:hypothetical protein
MSARSVAQEFFDRMEAGQVDGIIGLTAHGAVVSLVPLGVHGSMAEEGASYLYDLTRAFPDLLVRVRRLFVTTDNTAVAEITIGGRQAADFRGVPAGRSASTSTRAGCWR